MNKYRKIVERFFPPMQPLPSGAHHYQAPADAEFPYRLHLRLEQDGSGVLIVNASTVLHLSQTAAEYAFHIIQRTPAEEVAKGVSSRYQVSRQQALGDFQDLKGRLETLISTPDLDPVVYLGFERETPYSKLSAPYRLDCALTYRTTSELEKHVAPTERVRRELDTEEWQTILKKAWDAGIPQIIFTGGEPTLRSDLIDLIGYTEQLGQVTGLLTDGLRLCEKEYLHSLLRSGLDHLMILLDPKSEQSWEAIRDALTEDIFTTVHLTVTKSTSENIGQYIDQLGDAGVTHISLSMEHHDLKYKLETARKAALNRGMSLVWDVPVPYSSFHPVASELEEAGETVSGAGKAWLYIEPDGDVLPAQGMPDKVMGNLLNDAWDKIWHPG